MNYVHFFLLSCCHDERKKILHANKKLYKFANYKKHENKKVYIQKKHTMTQTYIKIKQHK